MIFDNKMYIYGGKTSVVDNSKKLYSYDFNTNIWEEENHSNDNLPLAIDSHNAAVYSNGSSDEMLIFAGFIGKTSKYSNQIFSFNFKTKQWKFYFKHHTKKDKNIIEEPKKYPKKRANSAMCVINNSVYIFGGSKGVLKMNDMWKFDLIACEWKKIFYEEKITPEVYKFYFSLLFNLAKKWAYIYCFKQ